MGRIRKAILAGLGVAGATLITGLKTEIPQTDAGWATLVGGAIVAGFGVGWATYKIRNDGQMYSSR